MEDDSINKLEKLATEYLECAETDLKVSRELFEKEDYTNAAYYFRQSAERLTQAFTLDVEILNKIIIERLKLIDVIEPEDSLRMLRRLLEQVERFYKIGKNLEEDDIVNVNLGMGEILKRYLKILEESRELLEDGLKKLERILEDYKKRSRDQT